jgi:protease IV
MTDRLAADVNVKGTMQSVPKEAMQRVLVEGCANGPSIALIDVDGLLVNHNLTGAFSEGDNPVSALREKLRAIEKDKSVKAVVLRINSPGGGVTASDIMHQEVIAFKKRSSLPVVACLMDLATGGAYYLATAADEIVAHPTTVTGGVGVVINLYNLSDVMGTGNIYSQSVKSGKYIDMGSLLDVINKDSKALLQSMTDEFHERFQHIACDSRSKIDKREATNFDGRVFTAHEAVERGFIDQIGYLDHAVEIASRRAGLSDGSVVMYHRPNDTAHSMYAITPNIPLQSSILPLSVPGLDRSRLPTFLYLWQPDPTIEKIGGI